MADQEKKQVPLRISSKLYAEIAEYLLTECVKQRKKNGSPRPENLDEGIKLDL